MDAFFSYIESLSPLSLKSRSAMATVLQPMRFSKGHSLLRPGGVCNYLYFIEAGLTRTWYLKNGKDVTDWISTEGTISVSIISFLTRQPDIRGIELLEPSEIWALSYSDLNQLYDSYPEIDRLGRLLISAGVVQLQKRFDDLHFVSAQDRYSELIARSPSLLQRVPLSMIASYLGISQETLSRMRAKY